MRRLLSIALIGLAVAGAANEASAQGRGRARGGVMDTARARRMDSLRVARGGDSLRVARFDSTGRGRGGRPGDIGNARFLLAGIELSEAEKANVKAINEKYAEELKQLRPVPVKGQPRVAPDPEVRARVQAVADRQRADIRAALTPEHQTVFDANVARGPGRRGGPPMDSTRVGGRRGRPPVQ